MNLKNNSDLQIGDTFRVIGDGMHNSSCGGINHKQNKDYIIKQIHNGGIFYAGSMYCNTIETMCGKFIWNWGQSLRLIKRGDMFNNYEIY